MKRLSPVLVAAAGLCLVTACSSGTSDDAASTATTSSSSSSPAASSGVPSAQTTPSAAPSESASPAAPGAQQLTLTVAGGKVTGDTGTVAVKLGQPVHLTVTSDVADEVHVHGADVSADVEAGGTVTLDFVQQAPGRFEVELESRRLTLTRLQVS